MIYDLLNDNQTEKIIPNASFQYYYLDNLRKDINKCLNGNLEVINFSTEPIQTKEIIDKFFPKAKVWNEVENPVKYDFRTKYDNLLWWDNGYIYSKEQVLNDLNSFISNYKN